MRTLLSLALLALSALPLAAEDFTIAVVGLRHSHTWSHLDHMAKGEHAKLVAIAETAPDLVAEAQKRAPGVPVFADYRKMLDQVKPNIVWAFVENRRHLEIVEACGPRKIHVVFEKPLAATYAQAVAIRKAATKHGIEVMTNFGTAWTPSYYTAKHLVDAGATGDLFRMRAIIGHAGRNMGAGLNKYFFDWLTDPDGNGAGALMDFGCYNALLAQWFLGKPKSVYAYAIHLRPDEFPKVEDHAALIVGFHNAVAILEATWDKPGGDTDMVWYGTKAAMALQGNGVALYRGKQPAEQIAATPLPADRSEPIGYLTSRLKAHQHIDGLVALDINVGVLEIIEAAKRSIKTGQAVKLPLAAN
jgi:predicted dehydrogenase